MPPKYLRNAGKPWAPSDDASFIRLVSQNTPTRVIGLILGRSELSVRAHAMGLDVSLKPTNQSPYNKRIKQA